MEKPLLKADLRILTGTHRSDRHGDSRATIPAPIADASVIPASLADAGREAWVAVAPELSRLGLLTTLDLPALELYARTFDEVAKLDAKLLVLGGETYTTGTGTIHPYPEVRQRKTWLDRQAELASKFGLDPAGRAKLVGKVNAKVVGGVARRQRDLEA